MLIPTNKELTKVELLRLNEFIQENSNKDLCWLDGYLTAVCSSPKLVMPSKWQKDVYSDVVFESMEQANEIIGLLMRFHNSIIQSLTDCRHIPIYDRFDFLRKGTDEQDEASSSKLNLVKRWCGAYVDGAELYIPTSEVKDPDVVIAMLPILMIDQNQDQFNSVGNSSDQENEVEDYADLIPQSIKTIFEVCKKHRHQYYSQVGQSTSTIDIKTSRLPNRNDLCFCGSGKKFKKCCLS